MARRALVVLLFLAAGLLMSGCFATSINSFRIDTDPAIDKALLGAWTAPCGDDEKGPSCSLAITAQSSNTYSLSYVDEKGKAALFDGQLVSLGGKQYLDVSLADFGGVGDNEAVRVHLMPLHSLWQLKLEGNKLWLMMMDTDKVKELAAADHIPLAGNQSQDDPVFTGDVMALRAFVEKHSAELYKAEGTEPWTRK